MNEEALKWLQEQYDKCFTVKEYGSIYHIYDEDYIRLLKMNTILGMNTEEYHIEQNNIIFEFDFDISMFLYNQEKVYLPLKNKFNIEFEEQKHLIKYWLNRDLKINGEWRIHRI